MSHTGSAVDHSTDTKSGVGRNAKWLKETALKRGLQNERKGHLYCLLGMSLGHAVANSKACGFSVLYLVSL